MWDISVGGNVGWCCTIATPSVGAEPFPAQRYLGIGCTQAIVRFVNDNLMPYRDCVLYGGQNRSYGYGMCYSYILFCFEGMAHSNQSPLAKFLGP